MEGWRRTHWVTVGGAGGGWRVGTRQHELLAERFHLKLQVFDARVLLRHLPPKEGNFRIKTIWPDPLKPNGFGQSHDNIFVGSHCEPNHLGQEL